MVVRVRRARGRLRRLRAPVRICLHRPLRPPRRPRPGRPPRRCVAQAPGGGLALVGAAGRARGLLLGAEGGCGGWGGWGRGRGGGERARGAGAAAAAVACRGGGGRGVRGEREGGREGKGWGGGGRGRGGGEGAKGKLAVGAAAPHRFVHEAGRAVRGEEGAHGRRATCVRAHMCVCVRVCLCVRVWAADVRGQGGARLRTTVPVSHTQCPRLTAPTHPRPRSAAGTAGGCC